MTTKSTLLVAIFTTIGLGLVVGTASNTHAKNRPTVSTAEDCFGDPSANNYWADDGELISSCCYDDGCWICNAYQDENGDTVTDLDDCVWDQSTAMPVRRYPVPTVGSLPGAMTGNPPKITVVPIPPRGGALEPPVSTPQSGTVGVHPVQVAPPVTPPRGTVGVYPVQVAPPLTPPRGTVGVYPVQVVPPVAPTRGTVGVYPVQVAPPVTPPRGTVGINPVRVVGVKQSGSGQPPVTIFARGRASSASPHPSLVRVRSMPLRAYPAKQDRATILAHAASYGRRR
jgi:hypothetical protein